KSELNNIEIINCPQLAEFRCYNNKLTSLNLINCPNLQVIDCSNNLLTKIELPLKAKKLEKLYLGNNNFPEQDLSLFKDLVNLKELSIGNYRNTNLKEISTGNYGKNPIRQDTYNRFHGSLEPLAELTKLELLEINSTDIDNGLEYLNDAVIVYCLAEEKIIAVLRKQLKKTREEKVQLEEQLQTEKEEFKKFQDKS
ncbi:15995_t:CDS:2, partial [Racocetra persica]